MILILLFGTPILQFLPVPVLTGIVMTALIGILDFKMFKRLWKTCKSEWVIFMLSFIGVLVLGTVNGVIVGCVLSFWEVSVRAASP
ncbi:sulfate transporter, partial [Xanthomonas citri pv. citri]|nr:sulfate transporter [Xanthomonas citri pv. citri]